MISLKDKIVLITGASAGIGMACAKAFANEGSKLILTARRINLLNEFADELRKEFNIEVYAAKLDVKNQEEVKWTINSLPDEWKKVDILINNAGLGKGLSKIYEDDTKNWEEMIDTNLKGLLYVTREVVLGKKEKKSGGAHEPVQPEGAGGRGVDSFCPVRRPGRLGRRGGQPRPLSRETDAQGAGTRPGDRDRGRRRGGPTGGLRVGRSRARDAGHTGHRFPSRLGFETGHGDDGDAARRPRPARPRRRRQPVSRLRGPQPQPSRPADHAAAADVAHLVDQRPRLLRQRRVSGGGRLAGVARRLPDRLSETGRALLRRGHQLLRVRAR